MKFLGSVMAVTCGLLCPFDAALARESAPSLYGFATCAAWSRARKAGGDPRHTGWVVGYLSGLATGAGVEFWGPGGMPRGELAPEGAFQWIDRYCAEYPMNTTAVASRHLFFERTGRQPVKP